MRQMAMGNNGEAHRCDGKALEANDKKLNGNGKR